MTDAVTYADHPLASIFPLLDETELKILAGDIAFHGLREPIVLMDRLILDGRNRYRACLQAGVAPSFTTYTGDDPVGLVVSLNLRRRHLNESQRAMVAAKLANLPVGRPPEREDKGANLPLLDGDVVAPAPAASVSEAAHLMNVSERTVKAARTVQSEAEPAVVQAVEQGKVAVSAAAEVAKLEPEAQATVAAQPEAAAPVARAIRTQDTSALAGLAEAIRPKLEKAVKAVIAASPRSPKPKPAVPAASIEPVRPVSNDWPDWTGAVEVIASLPTDLRALASELPTSIPRQLDLARAALPRLHTWITELEAVGHD